MTQRRGRGDRTFPAPASQPPVAPGREALQMLTFPGIKAHPRGVECPVRGRVVEGVVVKAYTAKNGHDDLHPRAACPLCDQWVKFIDKPGPWYPPRELVGLGKRNGYYKEAGR